MPKRVQMTRHKPWRRDHPDAVIVARPSKWGNPFKVGALHRRRRNGPGGNQEIYVQDAAHSVRLFRQFTAREVWLLEAIEELRGKDLACWCPLDQPCHADVLLKLANRPLETVNED